MLILFMVIPLFVIGLRFWTAPVYMKYSRRINSCCTPLCFFIIFFSDHMDVLLLGVLVWLMNIYVFWYHIDPPQTQYGRYVRGRYRHGEDEDE
jgi:hypothetical protein